MKARSRTLMVVMVALLASAGCADQVASTGSAPAATQAAQSAPVAELALKPSVPATALPALKAIIASPSVNVPGLSVEALRNATYGGIYEAPITLAGGRYEGKPVGGDSARPVVEYGSGSELYGDLDGDGITDAVVFLTERGGGSGAFTYVAAQLNRDGKPRDAGAVRIEDRIQVASSAIKDGRILLDIVTQGPGDVACCGTHTARKAYALQGGRLAEVAGQGDKLVKVSASDLNGTKWTLVELDAGHPALAGSEVTITFDGNSMSGSGGCNNYNGSFKLDAQNPFIVTTGPVASTKKMCDGPVMEQEAAYLAALQSVNQWGYQYGRLVLSYANGKSGSGRLLFARR